VYKHIVVGTDFSDTATKAVENAAQLAKAFDATLHIVTAFKPALTGNIAATSLEAMAYGGADVLSEAESRLGDEVEATLGRIAKHLADDGVKVKTHGIAGDPADSLIDCAERCKADLIVVGNRGMSGVKRFVLGSVANRITHHAPCSVLVAHTVE
jgi:nucleotide-binding universal stress UspA family protein